MCFGRIPGQEDTTARGKFGFFDMISHAKCFENLSETVAHLRCSNLRFPPQEQHVKAQSSVLYDINEQYRLQDRKKLCAFGLNT